jgi:hypothetical protein
MRGAATVSGGELISNWRDSFRSRSLHSSRHYIADSGAQVESRISHIANKRCNHYRAPRTARVRRSTRRAALFVLQIGGLQALAVQVVDCGGHTTVFSRLTVVTEQVRAGPIPVRLLTCLCAALLRGCHRIAKVRFGQLHLPLFEPDSAASSKALRLRSEFIGVCINGRFEGCKRFKSLAYPQLLATWCYSRIGVSVPMTQSKISCFIDGQARALQNSASPYSLM